MPDGQSVLVTRAGRTGVPNLSHPLIRPLTDLEVEVAVVRGAKNSVRLEHGTK